MLEVSKAAYDVPIPLIIVGQNQRQADNKGFTEASLRSLANSIDEDGLTSPITVRPLHWCAKCERTAVAKGDCCGQEMALRYMLVAGERRYRSITMFLKWETIPAFIEEMDDTRARAVMAHENIGRVNLNPMEEAAVYREFTEDLGLSEEATAERCSTTLANVIARLELLKLVPMAQELLRREALPITHANEMARLPVRLQEEALKLLSRTNVSFVQFKQYLAQLQSQEVQALPFGFTELWAQQVAAAAEQQAAMRSRSAEIFTSDDLPPVQGDRKDTAGDIIVRYMRDLHEGGHHSEASAVCNLLTVLLKYRKVKNFRENPDFEVSLD